MITLLLKINMLCEVLNLSYSSELTKERIITCAKKEFLKKGFVSANLRKIATDAKATTGAVYNHFNGKEGLFEEIVGEFADNLLKLYKRAHEEVEGQYDFDSADITENMGKGTNLILEYLYSDFELSKLLFCCAVGTKYEKFVDELIEVEEKSSLEFMENDNFKPTKINKFFVHVISTSGINNMLEAIHHDLSKEEAFEYIGKIQKFYYAGTKEILGF